MGHFYKTLETVEGWLVSRGVSAEQAAAAPSAYFTTFHSASKCGHVHTDTRPFATLCQ